MLIRVVRTERNVDNYKEKKKLDRGIITDHFKDIELFCKRRHGKKNKKQRKENVIGSAREGRGEYMITRRPTDDRKIWRSIE